MIVFSYIIFESLPTLDILFLEAFQQQSLAETAGEITDYVQNLRCILVILHHASSSAIPFYETVCTFGISIYRIAGNQLMKLLIIHT